MKENQIVVLNPIGRVAAPEAKIASRLKDLNKKKAIIIDNRKINADIVLNTLKDNLSSRYNFKEILYVRKKAPTGPADFIDEIPPKCDFVINGVGHWGSSSSWSVHDSVCLELKGVPTATIFTVEFARMAQFIAKSLGLSTMPLVITEHPLAGFTSKEEIIRKAEAVLDQVVYVLTQPRELLESEFRTKEYPLPSGVCPMTKPGI